jgi:hypothetical protein
MGEFLAGMAVGVLLAIFVLSILGANGDDYDDE